MADKKQNSGKKGRKVGRNKAKCAAYRLRHGGGDRKKQYRSKGERQCTPLGYQTRAHQRREIKQIATATYLGTDYSKEVVVEVDGKAYNDFLNDEMWEVKIIEFPKVRSRSRLFSGNVRTHLLHVPVLP